MMVKKSATARDTGSAMADAEAAGAMADDFIAPAVDQPLCGGCGFYAAGRCAILQSFLWAHGAAAVVVGCASYTPPDAVSVDGTARPANGGASDGADGAGDAQGAHAKE